MLAMMALVLRVMIPQGFMVADAGTGSGVPIVMCSGFGAYVMDLPGDPKAPPVKKHDAPCAFAGQITPLTPTVTILAPAPRPVVHIAHDVAMTDQAPGRGLAAPPPYAIGPPRLI